MNDYANLKVLEVSSSMCVQKCWVSCRLKLLSAFLKNTLPILVLVNYLKMGSCDVLESRSKIIIQRSGLGFRH